MKTRYAVALAMLAGFGLGAVAVQGLRAQAKPPLYYVTEIDVIDPVGFAKDYLPIVQPLIKADDGRFVALGAREAGRSPRSKGCRRLLALRCWCGTARNKSKLIGIPRRFRQPERSAKNMPSSGPSLLKAYRTNLPK